MTSKSKTEVAQDKPEAAAQGGPSVTTSIVEPSAGSYWRPGKVRFSDLKVDPSVQREVVDNEVLSIATDFDPRALGFLTVSVRSTGDKVLLDGLQRKTAAEMVDYDGAVDAILHYNLTKEEEAALFRRLNNRTGVSSIASYKVAITERVPEALAVDSVLREFGIDVGSRGGAFQAVKRALRIVSNPDGINDLRFAFAVAAHCWRSDRATQRLDGLIIEALAMIHRRDGALIEVEALMDRLSKRPNGQAGILGEAKTRQGFRGGRLPGNVADVIVAEYNVRRTKNRLPDWQR